MNNDPASVFIRLFYNIPDSKGTFNLNDLIPDQFGRIRVYNALAFIKANRSE